MDRVKLGVGKLKELPLSLAALLPLPPATAQEDELGAVPTASTTREPEAAPSYEGHLALSAQAPVTLWAISLPGLRFSPSAIASRPEGERTKDDKRIREPKSEPVPSASREGEPTKPSTRSRFGIGWLSDSLFFGVAVALDAMALAYSRARRLLLGERERREEKSLRQKIGFLHAAVPMPFFIGGFFAADALLATGSLAGRVVTAGLYAASGMVMYAFANNVLREESGAKADTTEGKRGVFHYVEKSVERFGNWLISRMPNAMWATAMGVTVDAVISSLKFVQSSGWSAGEAITSCLIAGTVVYGLITAAQRFGEFQLRRLLRHAQSPGEGTSAVETERSQELESRVDGVARSLSRFTAGGFLAFRYFAWFGFVNAGLTLSGTPMNEWGVRGIVAMAAVLQGAKALRRSAPAILEAKREDAEQFLGLAQASSEEEQVA